jgi:hypothetical protein
MSPERPTFNHISYLRGVTGTGGWVRILCQAILLGSVCVICSAKGQNTTTGAFEGTVTDILTGEPVEGARAEIINIRTGITVVKTTDARGRFYQGLLPPDVYRIRISMPGYQPREVEQELKIERPLQVVPVPVTLYPETAVAPPPPPTAAEIAIRAGINTVDASRSGSFSQVEVSQLPLGSAAQAGGTFDDLALLLPGVAPPPQTQGSVAGPGQGAGVGSAGQFSVNGLRSRANNFTVDGSDNNDEDIGVRRQGFVALIPQPIESIKEYQAITLLSPAQFGRNLGAQVNAVSKSGGNQVHGALYGFFNSSQLNARNFFDTANGDAARPLFTNSETNPQPVLRDGRPITVRNQSGGEDSFTFGKFGATLGGPVRREKTFYFLSGEGQIINAAQEENFVTPTVEQRGQFGSGATGITHNALTGAQTRAIPSTDVGNIVFSLFPFSNNPTGIYGPNTFTQTLPASARGVVLSAKLDHHFKVAGREQSVTGRYNYTDDWRQIPATGEALFSTLRPEVRAQNFSFFFNSRLSASGAGGEIFNQVRLSYGRTRLRFEEVRDRDFLLPSVNFKDIPFMLNAPVIRNVTMPATPGQPNTGPVTYETMAPSLEAAQTPLGQVMVAGFSAIGVDVFNFPQRRVNNTYQAADILTRRAGDHSLAFGADVRRSELNSDLQRLQRPLVSFGGSQRLVLDEDGQVRPPRPGEPNPFFRPEDLVALGAASNFFLTLRNERDDANINLRYYQLNFFAQDNWRPRGGLSISFGLRYEHNTPLGESRDLIEGTFNHPALDMISCPGTPPAACGFRPFLAGRDRIFDPDRNDFAPRVGVAYAPRLFGKDRARVFRAGYGIFYDQLIGAVVSQSRNVFPSFVTVNFGGTRSDIRPLFFDNPATTSFGGDWAVQPNTLNQLNLPLNQQSLALLNEHYPSALSLTLPERRLPTPKAHHYSFSFEQQLSRTLALSLAYAGTAGRNLLRLTTPNLGPNVTLELTRLETPEFPRPSRQRAWGRANFMKRPVSGVGAVYLFAASAGSRYDSFQAQLRGRMRLALQFDLSYTLSRAEDDVSDTFDLAGAFALPQNSLTLAGERGPANFDARHRVVYHLVFDLSAGAGRQSRWRRLTGGLQLVSVGRFQTGQPFTVNSIFDINRDGNLTDRLNTVKGLVVTGDGRQPLRLETPDPFSLLAPFDQDGQIGRNTFRAGALVEANLSVSKSFTLRKQASAALRMDIFNLFNRANFGIPARLLGAPGFGQAVRTVTPNQRIQLGLKLAF